MLGRHFTIKKQFYSITNYCVVFLVIKPLQKYDMCVLLEKNHGLDKRGSITDVFYGWVGSGEAGGQKIE